MGCTPSANSDLREKVPVPAAATGAVEHCFGAYYRLMTREEDKLGEGQFATVRKAQDKRTGRIVAVKCIEISRLSKEDDAALKVEVEVMRKLNHPNLVQLLDYFEDKEYYFLVMEMMTGGELFTRIVEKEKYSEAEAQRVIRTLTLAIDYCHSQDVVHRDLKPENILLADPSDDAPIKIADFGFAKFDKNNEHQLETACGTPGYVAPEILMTQRYGREVDVWSLGVVFYILLCGYPPFHHSNQTRLFEIIKEGKYHFDLEDWKDITENAKDLIRKILVVDPKRRLTTQEILAHPWFSGPVSDKPLPGTIGQLKRFNARRKLKAGFGAVRTIVHFRMLLSGRSTPGVDDSESKIDPLSPAALPDGAATPAGDAPPDADDAAVTGGDDDAVDAAGVGISLQGDEPGPAAVQPESVHNPVSV